MSAGLELVIPDDVHSAVEQMLVTTAVSTSALCGQFAVLADERNTLVPLAANVPPTTVSADDIIGVDKIAELPLDHAERQPSSLLDDEVGKLDKREQELKNSHTAIVRKAERDLWAMHAALKDHAIDVIGMAAVLETVTPYEGDRQTVLAQMGSIFREMRLRVKALELGMPVLGFESAGTDQLTTFGGVMDAITMEKGPNANVILNMVMKNGKRIARPLPPLLDPTDRNYLFYAGREQGIFAEIAYRNGLGLADVDQAMREARPQVF